MPHLFAALACLVGVSVMAACTPATELIEPACEQPLPLQGTPESEAPGYLVGYDSSVVDPLEIGRKLGFQPESVFSDWGFYVRAPSPQAVARLRCEPGIRYIEHNARTWIGKREAGTPNKSFQPIAREDARSG